MKKFFIIFASIIAFLLLVLMLFIFILYLQSFSVKLDVNKLSRIQNNAVYLDTFGMEIESQSVNNKLITGEVPKRFTEFLTLVEDRDFFKHKGVNVKRMFGALKNNIKSLSFKEGASTITQQLIKNTHLTNEKTLKRKVTEIRLSRELEKNFTKQEILRMYVNIIYFGSGFYGLESASYGYFGKSSYELSDNECALLVGLIKAPTRYSPISNYEKSIERKNVVLLVALKQGLIMQNEYEKLINEPIKILNTQNEHYSDSYLEGVKTEVMDILKLEKEDFSLGKYKIYTYYDDIIQQGLYLSHKNIDYISNNIYDSASLVIDNSNLGISAFYHKNKGDMKNVKRQIGSLMKPLLVYSPAFEKKLITPLTQILDEKISYGGYSPKNFDNSYDGYISVKDALKRSKNVPAVKVLEYVGLDYAKDFIFNLGIDLKDEEYNLGLALGGTKNGIDIFSLTNAYTTYANNGYYQKAHFVKKITDESGKVLFENESRKHYVMKDSTAYLTTDILLECSKSGTGRKMKDLPLEVATKTGTVGSANGNSDAYSLSYSKDYTVCSYLGSLDNNNLMGQSVLGGNYPTCINKECFLNLIDNDKIMHTKFDVPSSVSKQKIDKYSLIYEHNVELASDRTPIEYYTMQYFDNENTPHIVSNRFLLPKIDDYSLDIQNDEIRIKIATKPYYFYEVYEYVDDKRTFLKEFSTIKNEYELIKKVQKERLISYEIIPYFISNNEKIYGESLMLDKIFVF